jgi:signal transduction histidine kinase
MLVGELNLDLLQQMVEHLAKGDEVAYIVDHRGTIVAHPERAWVQEQRNVGYLSLVRKGLTDETVFELVYDDAQRHWVIGSAAPITWDWAVVMTQPVMVAVRPLLFLFLIAGVGFGLSILLFLWLQVSSLRKISSPIAHLAQKADALARQQYGDEAFMVAGGQFSEIVSLEHSFARMAKAIADHTVALMEANTALHQEIAERTLAEEQVRILNAELEHRVKQRTTELEAANRELKDFAYVTSHDLKAPLRGISRLAHWLAEDYADAIDDKGREMANLLIGRVKRMDGLIEGILHYSRIGRIEEGRQEIDLNALLTEVLDLLNPPSHIQIAIASVFPTIVAERTRIFQVFQNLIGNAIKFMDKPQGKVAVQCVDEDTHWIFRVSDNGPGIEQRHQDKIFQIFQTLHPRDKVESTGIGLALVKKIVDLYGGKIWVESTVGGGSTFFFTVPRSNKIKEQKKGR